MELVTGHQATPHITAEQVSRLLQGVTTMDDTTVYRLPIGNNCAVSVSSLDVSIDTGEIVLHGFHTTFEEGYTVTLDPTIDAAKSRIDKIVMEIIEDLTTGIQTANIEVVQGEESSSPVAPTTPVAPTSPTEKFLAVGVIATVTVSNITIASSVDNTELYAGSYISEEIFGKTVRNQSSDQYNTTKAYKVGNYVIHNDTLYKCITACSAGSWEANQNCFVTDTLTNAVTTLNSDLNDKQDELYFKMIPSVVIKPTGTVIDVSAADTNIRASKYHNIMVSFVDQNQSGYYAYGNAVLYGDYWRVYAISNSEAYFTLYLSCVPA